MSAPKVLIQVILTGTQIVGRAFVEAYKQAAANSANRHAANAAKSSADAATRQTGMVLDEAYQILNVNKGATKEEILEHYDKLFKMNDSKKGGSFYLQSKIVRAKERLELEMAKKEPTPEAGPSSPPPPPPSSSS
ncbi:mitochondrial import inner membrane translocase subunit TIM16 [Dimargaris cristalligena]|uniref:Mitochondrial import inner membrane translocase subunit TIM16 n=1 Tax=Dimargaris cristalligena TaxID=215637 RepID=A0A4V1J4Y5_9FUNG|nr:mitochondrial import inner membrane translocase subunit TIM16 [Dimargaris cristalligena]RKP37179.1 Pam16-domain-containing protein [Dimargaris cristalligena]|eukprot:RKP37179.1 Pam16-domain-containing protein [Dimargaris cristalligena]